MTATGTAKLAGAGPLTFHVIVDGEDYLLEDNLTVGRHLDNDIVAAGEDMLDYHARVELTPRGVKVHPLLDATVSLNQKAFAKPITLCPADQLQLGHTELTIRCGAADMSNESAEQSNLGHWRLLPVSADPIELPAKLLIGRAEDADLTLVDDHVSREHACVWLDQAVWLQDLGSANGTFVNGERVLGGTRLLHGDVVAIDSHRFALQGDDPELTPVKPVSTNPVSAFVTDSSAPKAVREQNLKPTVLGSAAHVRLVEPASPDTRHGGAYLLGASEPVVKRVFQIRIGTTVIGRDADCDIVIDDPSVSTRHAELITRAEGSSLTNLMATNGTKINDTEIVSQTLTPGDHITLGRVTLVYKAFPIARQQRGRRALIGWLALAAALAGVLALAFIF